MLTINLLLFVLTPDTYARPETIVSYNLAWLIIAGGLKFYSVERNEKFVTKFHRFLKHYLVFSLVYFALFAILDIEFSLPYQIFVLSFLLFLLIFYRWFFFSARRLYRIEGGNFVNVVVIGEDKNILSVKKIFSEPDYGYRYQGFFHANSNGGKDYLGPVDDCYEYILKHKIDEIYCLVSQVTREELKQLISFSDNNFKKLKLIPDNKEIFTRAMQVELYGTVPVINLRNSPLEINYAKYGKRAFDIAFSLLVIIFILSWLIPLLFIITRFDSGGPLFFKQLRHGYNKKPFWCYKFRSMIINNKAHSKMCEKNDVRVTRIGRFLRKTSIDELPQFFNVLRGEMSVVGPRPHMELHTVEFAKSVDKYLVRHLAKPGITGLAQIKGYRGEITNKREIINRIRFDIFYLEKWCPLLDLKIIYYTAFNLITGEEKAF